MKVVVLANMRWHMLSPSLYQLACPVTTEPLHLGYNGEVWFLEGHGIIVTVPDRDTGAQLLAKQLNAKGMGA
jgi:hypothetical protein